MSTELTPELLELVLNSDWLKQRDDQMRSEGWQYRDAETGTVYEIGWMEWEGNKEIWNCHSRTSSFTEARNTASRWGCDYRTIRVNPFMEKEND